MSFFAHFNELIKLTLLSMSVSKEEVNYVAGLAKLHLNEKEVEVLSRDMNNILSYMELLTS